MKESENSDEEMTKEKCTQFTPPYLNKYQNQLELESFPIFIDIEKNNPNKSQLELRTKEAKRLNIISDSGYNFIDDKNIKCILANENKNSNKNNDIYIISLPNCFMRISENNDISIKKENSNEVINDNIPYSNFLIF